MFPLIFRSCRRPAPIKTPPLAQPAKSTQPRDSYWGDTAYRAPPARAPALSLSEKELPAAAVPAAKRWRLAFPVFVVVASAPVLACTVVPALVLCGVMGAVPAIALGVGIFAAIVLGTALIKALEEWESAPWRR